MSLEQRCDIRQFPAPVPPPTAPAPSDDDAAHLRDLLEKQPACLLRIGRDGMLLACNDAGLNLFGEGNLSDVLDHHIGNYLVPEHAATWPDFSDRVWLSGAGSFECDLTTADAAHRNVLMHAVALYDHPDAVESFLVTVRATAPVPTLEQTLKHDGVVRRLSEAEARLDEATDANRRLVADLEETRAAQQPLLEQLAESRAAQQRLTALVEERERAGALQLEEIKRLEEITGERQRQLLENERAARQRIADLESQLAATTEEQARLARAVEELRRDDAQLRAERDAADAARRSAEAQIERLLQEAAQTATDRRQLEAARDDVRRQLEGELEKAQKEADRRLSAALQEAAETADRRLADAVAAVHQSHADDRKSMESLSADHAAAVAESMRAADEIRRLTADLAEAVARGDALETTSGAAARQLAETERRIDAVRADAAAETETARQALVEAERRQHAAVAAAQDDARRQLERELAKAREEADRRLAQTLHEAAEAADRRIAEAVAVVHAQHAEERQSSESLTADHAAAAAESARAAEEIARLTAQVAEAVARADAHEAKWTAATRQMEDTDRRIAAIRAEAAAETETARQALVEAQRRHQEAVAGQQQLLEIVKRDTAAMRRGEADPAADRAALKQEIAKEYESASAARERERREVIANLQAELALAVADRTRSQILLERSEVERERLAAAHAAERLEAQRVIGDATLKENAAAKALADLDIELQQWRSAVSELEPLAAKGLLAGRLSDDLRQLAVRLNERSAFLLALSQLDAGHRREVEALRAEAIKALSLARQLSASPLDPSPEE